MESFPEHLKISRSAEAVEHPGAPLEQYIADLELDLKEEIERIIEEEEKLGEGKAAQVFNVGHLPRSHHSACVKIWRPELQEIKKRSFVEYRNIQAMEPEEEFNLQDELYMEGFTNIPRPLAYAKIGNIYAMGMEKIEGYSLEEIQKAGAKISKPAWEDLNKLIFDLNINHGIIHRDLHKGNIMIKTDQAAEQGAVLEGDLFLIDFGLSKRIFARPTQEDYQLTIGNEVVQYLQDRRQVDELKPNPGNSASNVFVN